MNERTIPLLHCLVDGDEVLDFYGALGFEVTYDMRRPYLYLAVRRGDIHLHFGDGPAALDAAEESTGGALVMVDELESYHAAFTSGLRSRYGRVLATGRPRLTRMRPGQSRFTVVDPSGNSIIFIRSDEPAEVEYGGSKALEGLERAVDGARILREFKQDDRAAARVLDAALRRHGTTAAPVQLARALAARAELAAAAGDMTVARQTRDRLIDVTLTDVEREQLSEELSAADRLTEWLDG